MSECSNSVGKGSIMYKCRISPVGHDGPCAAPELGRSIVERQAWLAQHASETTVATEPTEPTEVTVPQDFIETVDRIEREVTAQSPSPVSGNGSAPIGAVQLGSFTDFEISARNLMNREELTPALNNWLTGTAAQIALNHLWRQANDAFEAGCVSITMTREELERFIPERLRPT